MRQQEDLWEPTWDFARRAAPFIPAALPYSLDDPTYLRHLNEGFLFGVQLCMRIYDVNNRRVYWQDLAHQLNHEFVVGVGFWEAIGVLDRDAQRELVSRVEEPYFGMVDISTWQSLRNIFGLPDEGIVYADYVDPRYVDKNLLLHASDGYPYFSGSCTGETTNGVFETGAGTSCCWKKDAWFIGIDMDLTRCVICYNDPRYTAELLGSKELECYPLWKRDGS